MFKQTSSGENKEIKSQIHTPFYRSDPEVLKPFLFSTQLSMKFKVLINAEIA